MHEGTTMLERFNVCRNKLTSVLDSCEPAMVALGAHGTVTLLQSIRKRLDSERLKVLILGQFKQGKSTLINALLGAEVLPAFAVPCTAVINEIKYGDEKRALVHFREPLPSPLPASLAAGARNHIERYGAVNVPPLEIAVEDVERYVVIPDPGKDHGESVAESPFRLVEIYWPIELCRNGVEIIDSPGLNEHGTRTRVTVDYLGNVDAVTFVLSCIALAGEAEMTFIENNLRLAGHEEIFFCCNRFDQVREKERQRVIDFGHEKLGRMTALGKDGIFFVSALDALEGRLEESSEKTERSGFLPFEKRLAKFLVDSRGRLKLLQPARQLITEVNKALNETIPQQQRLLRVDVDELDKRWQEVQPALRNAEAKCRQVVERVERSRERLRMEVEVRFEAFIRKIADDIGAWVAAYELKNPIEFLSAEFTHVKARRLVKEVSEFVDEKVNAEVGRWQVDVLLPYVQSQLEAMGEEIRGAVDEIVLEMAHISHDLNGESLAAEHQKGALERILSAGAGFVLFGPGAAMLGGMFGYQEMLKAAVPYFALVIGSLVLGITNPWVLIPLLLGGGAVQGMLKVGSINDTLKQKCGEQIAQQLKTQAVSIAREGASTVHKKTAELQEQIRLGLQQEVQGVCDSADTVMREKKLGEEAVAKRCVELERVAEILHVAQGSLQDIVFDLAQ